MSRVISDVMQKFRNGGYGKNETSTPVKSEQDVRSFSLKPEELKLVPEGNKEVCLSVYGTVSDGDFKISRVESDEGD